jgi:hypothetical protein
MPAPQTPSPESATNPFNRVQSQARTQSRQKILTVAVRFFSCSASILRAVRVPTVFAGPAFLN